MGLRSHPLYGAKTWLRANSTSLQINDPFVMARNATTSGLHTCALIDGNVMLMGVPSSLTSLDDYVHCLGTQLGKFTAVYMTVVVCFDETDHVPRAKLYEQTRRDKARANAASKKQKTEPIENNSHLDGEIVYSSLKAALVGDAYLLKDLENAADLHSFAVDRTKRYRLVDEIVRRLSVRFRSIVWDGVDARGAERQIDSRRQADFFCTALQQSALVQHFRTFRETAIGEGDLKLADLERGLRCYLKSPSLFLHCTIDTDAIPVQLALLAEENLKNPEHFLTFVAFRTPRKNESPIYEVLDVAQLQSDLARLCNCEDRTTLISSLFSACVALGGCDFVQQPACMRTSELLTAMVAATRTNGFKIEESELAGDSLPFTYEHALRCICSQASKETLSVGGRQSSKRALDLQNPEVNLLKKSAWCTKYWAGGGGMDCLETWGFHAGD